MIEEHLKNRRKRSSVWSRIRLGGCPDEAALAAFADGQLGDSESVEGHLAECDQCRKQVAFLCQGLGVESDADVPVVLLSRAEVFGAKKASTAFSPAWRWATAAAVSACLVLAISLRVREDGLDVVFPPPTPPSLDSTSPRADTPVPPQSGSTNPESQRTVRGGEPSQFLPNMLQPLDGAEIAGEVRFQWQPVSGSLFYEVRVTTAAGDPVWQSDRVSTPTVRLPSSIHLASGERYFVWAVAYLPEGKTVRSRAVAFTVRD